MEKKIFETEENTTRGRTANFLRELADRIESGRVVLRQGEREVAVELPEPVVLEVPLEVEDKGRKGTKRSLEVEIEWHENAEEEGAIRLG